MVKNFFYEKGAADSAGFNMENPSTVTNFGHSCSLVTSFASAAL